eukprot:15478859-Alexandrium_andersonii.AAC.1
MMAKPSLLEAFVRGFPRPSSGQRGSAYAASAWTGYIAHAGGQVACVHGRSPEHLFLCPRL